MVYWKAINPDVEGEADIYVRTAHILASIRTRAPHYGMRSISPRLHKVCSPKLLSRDSNRNSSFDSTFSSISGAFVYTPDCKRQVQEHKSLLKGRKFLWHRESDKLF